MELGYKEKKVVVIILDVLIIGVDISFVGFVEKNMIIHIIKIRYQCVLD